MVAEFSRHGGREKGETGREEEAEVRRKGR